LESAGGNGSGMSQSVDQPRPKIHQIGLPPYYERNVQSKSTSSVRGVALSLLPPFAAPPLGSVFGFRSRTASARFFSVGFGSLISSGMVESDSIRFRFVRSKINGLKSPTVSVDTLQSWCAFRQLSRTRRARFLNSASMRTAKATKRSKYARKQFRAARKITSATVCAGPNNWREMARSRKCWSTRSHASLAETALHTVLLRHRKHACGAPQFLTIPHARARSGQEKSGGPFPGPLLRRLHGPA
jgi:hypothetical protein